MGVEATVTQDLVHEEQGHCTTTNDAPRSTRKKKKNVQMSWRHEVRRVKGTANCSAFRNVQNRGSSHHIAAETAGVRGRMIGIDRPRVQPKFEDN